MASSINIIAPNVGVFFCLRARSSLWASTSIFLSFLSSVIIFLSKSILLYPGPVVKSLRLAACSLRLVASGRSHPELFLTHLTAPIVFKLYKDQWAILRALSSHQPLSASTNRKPLPVVAQPSVSITASASCRACNHNWSQVLSMSRVPPKAMNRTRDQY